VGNPEGRGYLAQLGVNWKILLNFILKAGLKKWIGFNQLRVR
jgi:hypothetical protein